MGARTRHALGTKQMCRPHHNTAKTANVLGGRGDQDITASRVPRNENKRQGDRALGLYKTHTVNGAKDERAEDGRPNPATAPWQTAEDLQTVGTTSAGTWTASMQTNEVTARNYGKYRGGNDASPHDSA